jgi:hypothetical protein
MDSSSLLFSPIPLSFLSSLLSPLSSHHRAGLRFYHSLGCTPIGTSLKSTRQALLTFFSPPPRHLATHFPHNAVPCAVQLCCLLVRSVWPQFSNYGVLDLYLHSCRLPIQLTAEAFAPCNAQLFCSRLLKPSKGAVSSMEPLELACHYPLLLEPINRSQNAALLAADSISTLSATSQLTQQPIYRQSAPLRLSSTLTRPAINPSSSWKESSKAERQKDSTTVDMVGTVHAAALGCESDCPA